ncbi:MAG: DUF547 domain-containing protein [Flavisolibacter sp.]|nr:DUF547 domain-containing protein [Flavisolibacter sp.]
MTKHLNLLVCWAYTLLSIKATALDTINYISTSQSLLYAVRTSESTQHYIHDVQTANISVLQQQLSTDAQRKAFWLNIYNAYVQKLLQEAPERYKKRNAFFTDKQIVIAGKRLSLDDIEHGILRRSKIKWSLGYFNKLFPDTYEKKFRVDSVDYRIHFALNCGAKSCPPIAYYAPEKIEQQLELATKNYLKNEVTYNREENIVYVPAIMGWFRADFGGKKGIKKLLEKHALLPAGVNPVIKFKPYDWTLFLNNYKIE